MQLMSERTSVAIYLTSMSVGGAERVALNLCKGFVNRGYDVDLVLVEATGDLLFEVPDGVSIINLESSRVLTSLLPLRRYLSSRQPDVLYSMMTEPNLVAIAAHYSAKVDTRLIISEHNTLSISAESIKDKLVMHIAANIYPIADHVVAVSEGVQRDLYANTRLISGMVSMIYNPIDVDTIREQAVEPTENKWLTDDSYQVVLSGGRHETQKGFDTLLKAFAQVEQDNVRLILFGKGPETESLKDCAATLGIEDRVCFPGFVKNPYSYMAAADVFVLSSEYEGFGIVLIEAMACGCPVVSTDCESGPAEILEDGKYGPLVPVNDDAALAGAINKVLCDPTDPEALQTRVDDFDIETAISQYESLFMK